MAVNTFGVVYAGNTPSFSMGMVTTFSGNGEKVARLKSPLPLETPSGRRAYDRSTVWSRDEMSGMAKKGRGAASEGHKGPMGPVGR